MSQLHLHPKLPKYARLAEEIREQIISGDLKVGERLPSFVEMRALHGVSQSIMERAYALLEEDNLIERQPGLGTFVAEPAKQNKTKILGLVLHVGSEDLATPYSMRWLSGVKREAEKHGLQIFWLNDQDENAISLENMDAILLHCDPDEATTINLPADMPHVLLFQHSPNFTCITADDFEGEKAATQYLLDLGHKRIAAILGSDSDTISKQRLSGYKTALQEAGIAVNPGYLKFLTNPSPLEYIKTEYHKTGELAMASWLKEGWIELGCTAIIAHNDEVAIGIIQALKATGLRVPEDVSVIGFDGTELCELSSPRLTTVQVPLQQIGERAVKVLLEQMEGGSTDKHQKIVLPLQLKLGESTAPFKAQTHRRPLFTNSKE